MAGDQAEMTLHDYGAVVWRRKWLVVLPVVVATLFALVSSALQTPVYSASSQVLIQPRGEDGLFDSEGRNLDSRSIETEIQVVEGEAVRTRVQENLQLDEPPPEPRASAVGDTNVISIAVRDTNASNAATIANAYAVAYIDVRREQSVSQLLAASTEVQTAIDGLQIEIDALDEDDPRRATLVAQQANFNTTLDQLRVDAALRTGGAAIIKTADVPSDAVEPTPLRTASLALVVGLLVGLGAAFLVDYLDDKVRSTDDLERLAAVPVLAEVPVDPPPDHRPIAISEPSHLAVEEYRGLRTNLLFIGLDRALKAIQVTSSLAGEGKTTTATNLAVVLARAGHRVALVDADLRRPRVHEVFGVDMSPGLTDVLLGMPPAEVVDTIEIADDARISVYTSGVVPANPSEMLTGRRVTELFEGMRDQYDYIVVDSSPALPVSDAVALTASVDAVLIVAYASRISRSELSETVDRLAQVGAPVVGTILNQSTERRRSEYQYGGYGPRPATVVTTAEAVEIVPSKETTSVGEDGLPESRRSDAEEDSTVVALDRDRAAGPSIDEAAPWTALPPVEAASSSETAEPGDDEGRSGVRGTGSPGVGA